MESNCRTRCKANSSYFQLIYTLANVSDMQVQLLYIKTVNLLVAVHNKLRSGILAMQHGRNLPSRLAEESAQVKYSTLLEIDVQVEFIILFTSGTLYCAFG